MNIAVIENDVIVNTIVSEMEWARENVSEVIELPENAGIGWVRVRRSIRNNFRSNARTL